MSCYISGGTASYILAMSPKVAAQADAGNSPANVKQLSLGWMYAFLFSVSFLGLFTIVPLRKVKTYIHIYKYIDLFFFGKKILYNRKEIDLEIQFSAILLIIPIMM